LLPQLACEHCLVCEFLHRHHPFVLCRGDAVSVTARGPAVDRMRCHRLLTRGRKTLSRETPVRATRTEALLATVGRRARREGVLGLYPAPAPRRGARTAKAR